MSKKVDVLKKRLRNGVENTRKYLREDAIILETFDAVASLIETHFELICALQEGDGD